MERYRSGHNGADSKSVCEQSHMGSNPILSAKKSSKHAGLLDFSFLSTHHHTRIFRVRTGRFFVRTPDFRSYLSSNRSHHPLQNRLHQAMVN